MSDRLKTWAVLSLFLPAALAAGWLLYSKVWPYVAPTWQVAREFGKRYPGQSVNFRVQREGDKEVVVFTTSVTFDPREEKEKAEEMGRFLVDAIRPFYGPDRIAHVVVQYVSWSDLIKTKQARVHKRIFPFDSPETAAAPTP